MLVEVLYVQAIVNGTAVTAVGLAELKKEHRRHKRDVEERKTISFRESHEKERKYSVTIPSVSVVNISGVFSRQKQFLYQ